MNIDTIIFVGFLSVNLFVGLFYSRGIKSIKEYAIGDRNFSTGTIAATLIATWISGSAFMTDVSEVYKNGMFYIIPGMFGDIFSWIIICYFIAPRMSNFLGSVSVAEAVGNLYGKEVRFIAAIASTFNCVGKVAAQFKVSATILQLFFGISSFYATLASCIIVIIYSAFGGIKAVTFTDIIQFFTFGTVIPVIALVIWGTFNDSYAVFDTISTNPLFDISQVFDIHHPKFWSVFTLALYFIIPSLNPAIFQRMSMARDTEQISNSFFIAIFVRLSISIMFFWIGILLLTSNPNLDSNKLFAYIIDNYTYYVGFKGIIAAGVMAMVMSTADSYINSAAVTFSYDIRKSLSVEISEKYDLPLSYLCSAAIGVLAFFLAFYMKGLLSIFLLVSSFYLPVVTVPLLAGIFGFRTTKKPVLIGIAAGLTTVIIWRKYFMDITDVDSVIPGTLMNLIFFINSHYLLKQPGGWIAAEDSEDRKIKELYKKRAINRFIDNVKNFNLFIFCKNNAPKQDHAYSLFGLFCLISVFSTMYSMPKEIQHQNKQILEFIYHTCLISSTILLTFPVWPPTFKSQTFIVAAWNVLLPYLLIFAPTILIIVSNFGQFQLMIFLLNLVVISLILRWQVAIFMIVSVVTLGVQSYKWYIGVDSLNAAMSIGVQFKIMYALLLISSILIAFIKPKQEYQNLTEERNEHLSGRIENQEKQLNAALSTRSELIRNLNHEYRTPMTGITSMAEVLWASYDKLNDEQRKSAAETIFKSSLRLEGFDSNLISLSKLSQAGYKLSITSVDLSELLYERLEICRKLYEENSGDRKFVLNIEDHIVIEGDKYYLQQMLDNLLINAITYCKAGKITVNLNYNDAKDAAHFKMIDEGIGIPINELINIFTEFTVSSKTYSQASGRGIGLALCKRVAEVHRGVIRAESDGTRGASFIFDLPVKGIVS